VAQCVSNLDCRFGLQHDTEIRVVYVMELNSYDFLHCSFHREKAFWSRPGIIFICIYLFREREMEGGEEKMINAKYITKQNKCKT